MPNPSSKSIENLIGSFRQSDAEQAKCRRIETLFPALKTRLDVAVKSVSIDSIVAEMACRHVLCAEALVEVLESQTGLHTDAVVGSMYSDLAATKLFNLNNRPEPERRKIIEAYPEINLQHILLAYAHGLLPREAIAATLEEISEYEALKRKLNNAGLL